MARFLFTILPLIGHINPTLPIAVELKKRGHRVGYALGPDLRYVAESEGLDFFPAGPPSLKTRISTNQQKILKHTGLISTYYFSKYLLECNQQTLPDMRAAVEQYRPDVIVADFISHAGAQMAEVFGLPWAMFSSVPGLIPSLDAPPCVGWGLPPSDNPLLQAAYALIRIGRHIFLRMFDRDFNRIRASLGLEKMPECLIRSLLSPYLILIPSIEGFEYPRSDWPPQAHLIGPAPWGKPIDNTSTFEWIDHLPADRPVIYATMGTIQVFRSLAFFKIVLQALKDEPCQLVMSVGPAITQADLGEVPKNVRIEQFVPHTKMLPRCTAVIHHGGQGIAQDSIYYGLPSVVVPVAQDLFEVARRCTIAGVSVSLPYPRLTPERLRSAVRRVLAEPCFRDNAQKLGLQFARTDAGATGAALLEQLAQTKKPVYRS